MRKETLAFLLSIVLVLGLAALPVFAAKPTTFTVNYYQAQFQWRGISAFGDWTPGYSYQNSLTSSDFELTGNTLHTSWSYSPLVTDLTGQSTVYTYDKISGLWIEHEGQVSYKYVPGYGDYQVVNFFRGYVQFDGTPSAGSFVHGVAYQWVYLYAPQDAILTGAYTANAQWDAKVGAWLVGFSIYLWDTGLQTYHTSAPLETVMVPAGQDTSTLSAMTLQNGVDYVLVASGTANAGDSIEFDAKYSFRTGSSNDWTDSVSTYESYGPTLLDLQVNGGFVDWGAFDPAHVYSLPITGNGAQLSLLIYDIYYPNNVGNLGVDIYDAFIAFPDPFIEPVPANNYNPLGL